MDEEKRKQGQPTKYRPEYDKQAYKLCLLGATDKELGDFFEVDERTINNWKIEHPTFFQSIKSGKIEADAVISSSLFKSAKGYTSKEITYERMDADINPESEEPEDTMFEVFRKKVVVKDVAPNPTAIIFWLKNRQPQKWRDKQEVGLSGNVEIDIKPITWVDSNSDDAQDN